MAYPTLNPDFRPAAHQWRGDSHVFTYDTAWKDRLTANGQYPLTYDAIGNLKSYGGWTFEWEAGRQLKRQTQNATVVTYDYDHNGMRVRKTVANTSGYVYTTYNYTWRGGQLAHMTKGTDELHFFYDAQGRPAKVSYNGTIYTYVHNLQGDIVGILDANGTVVVEYKYNAWGAQLSRTGELANTLGYANPFRYRGYIYDDETWMYWLRSRYYYPELHRFISADSVMDGAGLFSANLYAYCKNAPVSFSDESGFSPEKPDDLEKFIKNYEKMTGLIGFKPRIYGLFGARYIDYEFGPCDVEPHVEGEEFGWLQNILGFLGSEKVGDLVTCALMACGFPVSPDKVDKVFYVISNLSTGLDAYCNTVAHTYYVNTLCVNVNYKGGDSGKFTYQFTSCNREGCSHYDGIHVFGAIDYGWIFPCRIRETYYPGRLRVK